MVTFLGEPPAAKLSLPIKTAETWILTMYDSDVLSVYFPGPRATRVMPFIEKTFGNLVTTRTWETVMKCAGSSGEALGGNA